MDTIFLQPGAEEEWWPQGLSLENTAVAVSNFIHDVPKLRSRLSQSVLNFKAGNISNCLDAWRDITDNRDILETVCGLPVELEASRVADLAQPIYPHSRDLHQLSMEISKTMLTVYVIFVLSRLLTPHLEGRMLLYKVQLQF